MRSALRQAALAVAIACTTAAIAAQPREPQEPVDSGAIIMPPPTDPKAVEPAPKHVDPEIAVPPARKARKPERIPERKKSKQDDCKGRAALCKQDSAK